MIYLIILCIIITVWIKKHSYKIIYLPHIDMYLLPIYVFNRNFYFIIDTGSNITFIEEQQCSKYNIEYNADYSKYFSARVLGKEVYRIIEVLPNNLIQELEKSAGGYPILGIIGNDVLSRYKFILSNITNKIYAF